MKYTAEIFLSVYDIIHVDPILVEREYTQLT